MSVAIDASTDVDKEQYSAEFGSSGTDREAAPYTYWSKYDCLVCSD